MPGDSRTLQILLRLRDEASQELKTFGTRVEAMQPTFRRMAAVGTVAFGGVAFGISKAVEAAGAAQDIDRLFSLAFDETEERMSDFVDSFSDEFGRAETRIQQQAADIGFAIKKATDLSEPEIAGMTEQLVHVAEGLALVDTRIESGDDAMRAITDAFSGGNQQLGRFIGGLRESEIQAKAVEMGLADSKTEVDKNARSQALFEIILDNTTAAQERLENAEGDYTDTKQRLNDTVQEVTETLGERFLPIVSDVLQEIQPVVEQFGEWVDENPELARNLVLTTGAIAGAAAAIGLMGIYLPATITGILYIGTALKFLARHPYFTTFTVLAIAIERVYSAARETRSELDKLAGAAAGIDRGVGKLDEVIRETEDPAERRRLMELRGEALQVGSEARAMEEGGLLGAFNRGFSDLVRDNLFSRDELAAGERPEPPQNIFNFNGDVVDRDNLIRDIEGALDRQSTLRSAAGI